MKFFYCIATVVALVGTLATGTAIAQTSPVAPMGAISAASSDGRTADTWLRDGDTFSIQYGVYTKHRSYSAEHVDHNRMVNLEIQSNYDRVWGADKTLFGASVLRNSFGQPSQWVYWGQRWDVNDYVYVKVTAGLLHGYKGKYRDKIPFNKAGVAPGIIPTLGVRYKGVSLETILLGTNALMFAVGYQF